MSQDRGRSHITVEQLLAGARARLDRLAPERAHAAVSAGGVLIDIRSEFQRERDGVIPRFAIHCPQRPGMALRSSLALARPGYHRRPERPILICNEGYQSSLAAATLQQLGLVDATDVIGGFQAWKAAGLPVEPANTAADPPRSVISPRRPPDDEEDERLCIER